MKNTVSIALIAGILLLVNLLSNRFFLRFDLTADKQYTLSKATKDILKNLENPVTVTAYFSEGLEPSIAKTKEDLREMLTEYANYSKGNVDYQFIDPDNDEKKAEAQKNGIRPVQINVRQSDEIKIQEAYMGAVIEVGEQKDVIPVVQPGIAMEYALSTGIKRISVLDKPSIGLIQGHGEPSLSDLGQAYQSLSILYSVENIDLSNETEIATRFKAVAIIAPKDSFPGDHLNKLDQYLSNGGKLFIAINRVNGDLQTAQGSEVNTGLETWLKGKGIEVDPQFLIDEQCGAVTVQQQQGFITFASQVQFPFLPIITNFPDHPISKGLEQVILQFASPIRFTESPGLTFKPIAYSSEKSGTINAPTFFDINNMPASFPISNQTVGGVLEGNINGNTNAKIVVIGDGDFPVSGQNQRINPDNISLMVNSIDWLSDDTGLIDLRTKGVASRPIDSKYLGDDGKSQRTFLKYLNFGLPILLIILFGFYHSNRQRSIRLKRREESYV